MKRLEESFKKVEPIINNGKRYRNRDIKKILTEFKKEFNLYLSTHFDGVEISEVRYDKEEGFISFLVSREKNPRHFYRIGPVDEFDDIKQIISTLESDFSTDLIEEGKRKILDLVKRNVVDKKG